MPSSPLVAISRYFSGRIQAIRAFSDAYHPIVHSLLLGTVLARAASSMSMPFLALYLAKHANMSPVMIGVVIGAGSLAGTFGGFFGGALSDRFGRKSIMMGALYAWGLIFIGFSLASQLWMFLALNMVNGLCRSFYEPVSQALMADLTPKEKRFRVFSLRYLCINIGVAVGPMLGAMFGMMSGRLPFFLTGLVYLVYAATLLMLLNKFGIRQIEGERKERISIGSAWSVVRRDTVLRRYLLGGVLGAVGYSQMAVTLSQYIDAKGLNEGIGLFATLMSVNAIVVVLFQVPLVRWIEKRPPLFAIVLGGLFFALGDVGYAFSDSWLPFILSMVVFTFGEIMNYPAANLLIDRLAPEGLRGTYYGAQAFSSFGHFLGPWIGGFFLQHWNGSVLFVTMGAVTLGGTGFYWAGQRLYDLKMRGTEHHGEKSIFIS